LIVAPVALIHQWAREIQTKSSTRMFVYIHHGPKRHQHKEQLRQYDVVITTYTILSHECPRPVRTEGGQTIPGYAGGPLFKTNFQRVILDESQIIKNHRTTASLACSNLLANTRFSLSGTPIQNSIEDIFSQFRFLQVPIWGDWEIFCKEISSLIKNDRLSDCKTAIHKVQAVLRGILLRRTKRSLDSDGNPILRLPEKLIEEIKVKLSTEQMNFYHAIEGKATFEFERIVDGEGHTMQVPNMYSSFLVLLLRMRQACTHPHLIKPLFDLAKKGQFNLNFMNARRLGRNAPTQVGVSVTPVGSKKARKVLTGPIHHRLVQSALNGQLLGQECPLCMDVMQDDVFTKCGHLFCKDCIETYFLLT
jgi:SNF2 family DNA or RNA helicase